MKRMWIGGIWLVGIFLLGVDLWGLVASYLLLSWGWTSYMRKRRGIIDYGTQKTTSR